MVAEIEIEESLVEHGVRPTLGLCGLCSTCNLELQVADPTATGRRKLMQLFKQRCPEPNTRHTEVSMDDRRQDSPADNES